MPGLNDFLSRIQTDYAFYLQFRQNPQEALGPYELSVEERATLAESDPQLPGSGTLLNRTSFTTDLGWSHTDLAWIHIRQTVRTDFDFDLETVLGRSEVQQAVMQIRGASSHTDRLAAVLTLIGHIA